MDWLSPNPFRTGGKDPAMMTPGQINRELDALDKKSEKLTGEFIEAGRGSETYSETLKKADPLALRFRAIDSRRDELLGEIRRRAGPNMYRMPTGRMFGPRSRA